MTPIFIERANAVAEMLVAAGWSHFLQTLLLAALLALIDFTAGRRIGPHWRCALWLIFFVKLALPPQLALPSSPLYWRTETSLAVLAPVNAAEFLPATALRPGARAESWEAPPPGAGAPVERTHAASVPARLSWRVGIVVAWAAGAGFIGWASACQRRRLRCAVEAPPAIRAALGRAQVQVGLRRFIGIRVSDTGVGPMVAGLWRPVVYLPRALLGGLTPEQLHAVLVHEVLHVKRGDLWVAAVQMVARAVFFYHPAVWWVNAHLARLREEATDRAVLAHREVDVHAYSLALVAAAEVVQRGRPVAPFALGVIETKSQLRKRILMNLNHPRPQRARLGVVGLISLAALGFVLVPMAPAGSGEAAVVPSGFMPTDAAGVVQRVDAAVGGILAAFNRRDQDSYLAAFTPDVLMVAPGAPLIVGHEGVGESYFQTPQGLRYETLRWTDRRFHRIGRLIVETGLVGFQFRLDPAGPIMTDPRQALTIWEEDDDGGLRVKLLAWNPLPQSPDFDARTAPRAFVAAAPAPFSTRGDFEPVLQAEEAFHRAFEEQRLTEAAQHYAEHATLFGIEGHPVRGNAAIRDYLTSISPARRVRKIDRQIARVEGSADHVLVVNLFRWTVMSADTGTAVTVAGKGVHLWQRGADGAWRILFDLPNPSAPSGS